MNQLPEKDLPPGRHRLLKEHLMTEIRQDEQQGQQGRQGRQERQASPVRRGWLRPAIAAAAVVTAAAVTFVVLPSGPSGGPSAHGGAPSAAEPATNAAQLLENIALAAASTKTGDIRDDQYTYVRTKSAYGIQGHPCTAVTAGPLHTRELWRAVDGKRAGLLRDPDGVGEVPLEVVKKTYPQATFYRNLEKLPTDPDKMLAWLYKNKTGEGRSDEDLAFDQAGELLRETYLPPKVSAALYRAVAKIPGIVVVKDSVDAVGRRGIAVGYVGKDKISRDELIFDKKSLNFLGTRDVVLKDAKTNPGEVCDGIIKAGSVQGTSAILDRAVVDKAGQRP
jgi:hypothetical protein